MLSRRNKHLLYTSLFLVFLVFLLSTFHYRRESPQTIAGPPPSSKPPIRYKPVTKQSSPQIVDNFPLAAAAHSARDLPPIPVWNTPPRKHVEEQTPLYIGFTRNWRILQQVVVSYITAGWPPEDIYVVENTGVMDSNAKGLLSLQNPFFLNHTRLHLLGVNVLVAPTLLTFAQLQNYFIWTSIEHGWKAYFWGHMDIGALSYEDRYVEANASTVKTGESGGEDGEGKYKGWNSLYMNCVLALRDATKKDEKTGKDKRWAMRFFNYDKLALVNVAAYVEIGAWDTQIPYYMTDCDMHARINMAGLEIADAPSGLLIDVGSSIDDLYSFYRKQDSPAASFVDPASWLEEKKKDAREIKNKVDSREESRAEELEREGEPRREVEIEKTASNVTDATPISEPRTWRSPDDDINSPNWHHLLHTLEAMQNSKASSAKGRNMWQTRQHGGEGEPFYRDSEGFEVALKMTIEHGRKVFSEKWGHRDCDIWEQGLKPGDAWLVEKDW